MTNEIALIKEAIDDGELRANPTCDEISNFLEVRHCYNVVYNKESIKVVTYEEIRQLVKEFEE
jgi:hypothetical protein